MFQRRLKMEDCFGQTGLLNTLTRTVHVLRFFFFIKWEVEYLGISHHISRRTVYGRVVEISSVYMPYKINAQSISSLRSMDTTSLF